MMNLHNILISTLIMMLVTFFTRVFPFIFFRNRKPPEIILFMEKYLPPMIMTILVIFCLKDIKWVTLPFGLPEVISVFVVAILHLWKRNSLISIFSGTILYMVLTQTNIISDVIIR